MVPSLQVHMYGLFPTPHGFWSEFRIFSRIISLLGVNFEPLGQVQVGAPLPPHGRLAVALKEILVQYGIIDGNVCK